MTSEYGCITETVKKLIGLSLNIMMKEVVVYLKQDYSTNKSIWVSGNLTKKEITKEVNNKFKEWYSYDIL